MRLHQPHTIQQIPPHVFVCSSHSYPERMSASVVQLLDASGTVCTQWMRSFLTGPRGSHALPPSSRTHYLLHGTHNDPTLLSCRGEIGNELLFVYQGRIIVYVIENTTQKEKQRKLSFHTHTTRFSACTSGLALVRMGFDFEHADDQF